MNQIMYRDENIYGSGINDILDVISYEVYELGNTDILEYCLDHYVEDKNLKNRITDLVNNLENYSDLDVFNLVQDLVVEINYQIKSDLKYCIWLASEQAVKDLYDGSNINAYYISDIAEEDFNNYNNDIWKFLNEYYGAFVKLVDGHDLLKN